ncbi:MAG TPA: chain length determinant protein EpsF [Rhizobacter sp.]|nr:chain length determinant protein EpsF [Rhizobacter sp.]
MSLTQLLRIVLARKWYVVAALLICSLLGTIITLFFVPKQYSADASMVLEIRPDPVLGALAPSLLGPAYMSTQIEIIKSDRVAARVVRILGLAKSPAAVQQWRDATQGKIPLERFFAGLMQRGLVIEPSRGSNLITLTFISADAAFAAAAANAFAQAYMETSVELRVEPARQSAEWLDEQTKTLRANLEQAQARLSKFQQDKGIIVSEDRLDQETARLNVLSSQLAAAQIERVDASSRLRNTGTELSPEVQQSGAVQNIKMQLAAAETKLSEISIVVGVNHPQRIQLEAQIAQLKQQLASEMKRVSGGTSVVSRSSSQKVEELRALVEEQKRRLLALSSERDQIIILQRDVETAKRAFETVSARVGQLNLESRNTQAEVRLLTPAIEPLEPSRPNVRKNVGASVVVGLILGLALAVGLEFLDRRIRGPEDLLVAAGVPVLGVLRPAGSKQPVFRQLLPGRPVHGQLTLPMQEKPAS